MSTRHRLNWMTRKTINVSLFRPPPGGSFSYQLSIAVCVSSVDRSCITVQHHAGQRQQSPGVQPFENTDINLLLDIHVFVVIRRIDNMNHFKRQAVTVKPRKWARSNFVSPIIPVMICLTISPT